MNLDLWGESLKSAMVTLWTKVAGFVPNLVAAVTILAVGYVVSRIFRKIIQALLLRVGFDKLADKVGLNRILARSGVAGSATEVLGRMIFWLFMLLFLVSSAETVGLDVVSQTINALVLYLPKVIGASLILVLGLAVAEFVRGLVASGAESIGVDYATGLGSASYTVLAILTGALAIGQLDIETTLLNQVIQIVLVVVGVAIALSIGLGSRRIAGNVISGIYARELYQSGDNLSIGEDRGIVEEIGRVTTTIRSEGGKRIFVPDSQLIEDIVRSRTED